MKLLVTAKAKGEVIFPTINYPVKAGQFIYVDKNQYYANDIQSALKNEYLKMDDGDDNQEELNSMIEIVNISPRSIGIGDISLLSKERKHISEEAAAHPQVELAVNQGLVELIYPDEEEEDDEEEKPKPKKKKKKSKSKKAAKKAEVEGKENDETEAPDISHKMQSWDPETKSMLNKEESSARVVTYEPLPESVKSSQEGVQVGDIDFDAEEKEESKPKKTASKKKKKRRVSKKKVAKSVAKKPSNGKKIKLSAYSKEGSGNKKSKSSIKPVGTVRTQGDPVLPNEQEISFVDREQTVDRMRQRGIVPQNDEID